ncbi:hypothetical protein FEM48_Zijuj08G0010200 [Ziziphus jujuba var. spinosa]|uniref:Uncharacterized protein n=1 Tax=Ziziphus jujuba var. spinosa TaxID=714518 RepID=A0A978UW31_ZIZJJ|nr:hypothetical protein FEM48_Zijuj08G0010200 [Ziziphus jujuba var. spinosa]
MPGTISVSVLEFMGLPFSSPFSSISIKVSMGKREYQTWDKGEFSFPLMTLRDNLIVLLQDAEGNEISHAVVETKSIVEKGLWDDFFPLEGGGQVHMKLQFILNEDERNQIRLMRESLLNKKHGELFNDPIKSLKSAATAVGRNAASSLSLKHHISDRNEETTSAMKVEAQSLHPNMSISAICLDEASFSLGSSELVVPARNPLCLQEGSTEDLKRQGLREKASNNVRKMISAFESSLAQETRSHIMPNNIKRAHSTGKLEELSSAMIVRNNEKNISPKNKVNQNCEILMRTSSTLETHVAESMALQLRRQNCNLLSRKQRSDGNIVIGENQIDVTSKHNKKLDSQGTLAHKLDSVVSFEDLLSSFEGSGAWICPDQAKRFCITTGGKKLMDLLGGQSTKPDIHDAKMNFPMPEKVEEPSGDNRRKPENEDVEASEGTLKQAIKIAIMVGFGTLILLTRQRNYR